MAAKIFYISDTHFGHANIILLDGRPFKTVAQMDQAMIDNWNAAVRKCDTVYILGDFCWCKTARWIEILNRLNGKKILIRGNHDVQNPSAELRACFADMQDYLEIRDAGRRVILCHYPIPFYKNASDPNVYMLYGHVHYTREYDYIRQLTDELQRNRRYDCDDRGQLYHVGCMTPWMNYTPRTLDEIVAACPLQQPDL